MAKQIEIAEDQNVTVIAESYLDLLLKAQRKEAIQFILEQVEDGLPLKSVYLQIIQPVMYEIGRLWQTDEIDIAVEHYCSASTQLLMAQLFPYVLSTRISDHKMVGCCLGSELHEMGMRIVCDFFEIEGWDTYFSGAITPIDSIIAMVNEQQPDILCLSSTMSYGVHQTKNVIERLRSKAEFDRVKIMVGGLAFIINPELYKLVGADAMAKNAEDAIIMANKLL